MDRLLRLADATCPAAELSALRALRSFLLIHVALAHWLRLTGDGLPSQASFATSLVLVPVCVLALWPRVQRPMLRLAAALLLLQAVLLFPAGSNHSLIELLAMAGVAFLDPTDPAERRLLGQSLRWMTVVALFYTGFQKVLYGTYFGAEYLGFAIATRDHFAQFFALFVPAEELARLTTLPAPSVEWRPDGTAAVQGGPYAVRAPLVVGLSNAVWIAELVLPALLLWRPTRPAAVLGVVALLVGIELGARELFFGALMVNLLLLFLAGDWNRRLLPAFVVFYLALCASRLGLLPALLFYT